jgi:hypothetical protein
MFGWAYEKVTGLNSPDRGQCDAAIGLKNWDIKPGEF